MAPKLPLRESGSGASARPCPEKMATLTKWDANAFSSVLGKGHSGPRSGCPISLDRYTHYKDYQARGLNSPTGANSTRRPCEASGSTPAKKSRSLS